MRRVFVWCIAGLLGMEVMQAQGTLSFANTSSTLVRFAATEGVPASLRGTAIPTGTTAADGPADFRVQLFWGVLGSTELQLVPIDGTALIAPLAGRFSGGSRVTLPATPAGAMASFQVRVWSHGSRFATYEAALSSADPEVYIGSSEVFDNPTGGSGAPPSPPASLSGFPGISNVRPALSANPDPNTAPVFATVPDQVVNELATLTVANEATDAELPVQALRYALVTGPAGMTVDAMTGVVSWTPSEAQGPGVYGVEVQATDNGVPALSATYQFDVTVNELNAPPLFAALPNQATSVGALLEFTVGAGALVETPGLRREVYLGVPGTTVADLLNAPAFPASPSSRSTLTGAFEAPQNVSENYGQRISGLLLAPVTGDYVFWIASDDSSTLFLGTDENATSKRAVASVQDWTNPREWTKFASQRSAPVSLVAGGHYYIEALMKEGGGGDHLSVRWQMPSGQIEEPLSATRCRVRSVSPGAVTDPDLPAQTLTFSLGDGSPAGATIDPMTGRFTWTPTEAQGQGTYAIVIIATDNGVPTQSSTQTLTVVVTGANRPPQIGAVSAEATPEGELWSVAVSASDPDQPGQTLAYFLAPDAPDGVSIESSTGRVTWVPAESQGPGTYDIGVTVRDNGNPVLSATTVIQVTVTELNQAPALGLIPEQTLAPGENLNLVASATDGDVPANALRFSLDPGAPSGMTIDPVSGLVRWSPTDPERPGTYGAVVRVIDNGVPELSATRAFNVVCTTSLAGGTVVLANNSDTLVRFADLPAVPAEVRGQPVPIGSAATTGPADFRVALYWGVIGSSEAQLRAIGVPALVAPVAGRFAGGTHMTGPETPPGATGTFQVRVWSHGSEYPTFELALGSGRSEVFTGKSALFENATGGGGSPPSPAVSLNGFTGVNNVQPLAPVVVDPNTPPVLAGVPNQTVDEWDSLLLANPASDSDVPGQTLLWELLDGAPGMSLDPASGVLAWTPTEAQGPGTYLVRVRVTDNGTPALSDTQEYEVSVREVNRPPLISAIPDQALAAGESLQLTVVATDPDLPAAAVRLSLEPGAPPGLALDPETGRLSWMPSEGQRPATFVVTVRATDEGVPPLSTVRAFAVVTSSAEAGGTVSFANGASSLVRYGSGERIPTELRDTPVPAGTDANAGPADYRVALYWGPLGSTAAQLVQIGLSTQIAPLAGRFSGGARVTGPETPPGSQGVFQIRAWSDGDRFPTYEAAVGSGEAQVFAGASELFTNTTGGGGSPPGPPAALAAFVGVNNVRPVDLIALEVNHPPTFVDPGVVFVDEQAPFQIQGIFVDEDSPAQALRFELLDGPAGLEIDPVTGLIQWTPLEWQGPASFLVQVRVTDHGSPALSAEGEFVLTVNEINTVPILHSVADRSIDVGAPLAITLMADDADLPAQSLRFELVTGPSGMMLDPATGVLNWPAEAGRAPGLYPVTARVVDDGSPTLSANVSFQVTVFRPNSPPSLAPIEDQTVMEHTTLLVTNLVTDPDLPGQTLTFAILEGPTGLTVDAVEGVVSWTPGEDQGPGLHQVRVRVTDDGSPALSATNAFEVTVLEVNAAPTLVTIDDLVVDELTTLTVTNEATDVDLPVQVLTHELLAGPPGLVLDSASGVVHWTPSEAQGPGTYEVRIKVSDTATPALSATNEFSVTVREVNLAPILTAVSDRTHDELAPLSLSLTAIDPDRPDQHLTFSVLAGPAGLTVDPVSGQLAWTPSESQGPGIHPVQVKVTDDGDPVLSATVEFQVTVREVNAAPSLAEVGDQVIPEEVTLTLENRAFDSDLPAQHLGFELVDGPEGMQLNPETGRLTWTPSEAQGPDTYPIALKVTDDGVPARSALVEFQVTVSEVNRAPVAVLVPDQTVPESIPVSLLNAATDSDLPAQALRYELILGPFGATLDENSGVLTWVPAEWQGPATHVVRVRTTDNGAPPLSVTNQYRITVEEVNTAPVLAAVTDRSVDEGILLVVPNNATDSDLPAQALHYGLAAGPAGAAVDPNTGELSWTPSENQGPEVHVIRVTVTDNGAPALSSTNEFRVTVREFNTAPVLAVVDAVTVDELNTLTLTNEVADADLPAQALVFELLQGPAGAGLDPETGVLEWTPTEAQGPGVHRVQVKVVDNGSPALSATNEYLITVREVNTAPTLAGVSEQSVRELNTFSLNLNGSDADQPGQTLTYTLLSGPSGLSLDPVTGRITWTPNALQGPGSYVVRVKVNDDGSPALDASTEFRITVIDENKAPVLAAFDDPVMNELTTLVLPNEAIDVDLPPQRLHFELLAGPAGATLDPATGVLTWRPSETQGPGIFPITVKVSDDGNPVLSDTNEFQITVHEVNAAPVLADVLDKLLLELATLSVTLSATDSDVPTQTIRYELVAGPEGTSLDPVSGLLSWTPAEAQGPLLYYMRYKATDNGVPALSVTNEFRVLVREVNQAPVFDPVPIQVAKKGQTLTVPTRATDADLPSQTLTYALLEGPPGLTLSPATGELAWTPALTLASGDYTVRLKVTDNGSPALNATTQFTITLREANTAPILAGVADQVVTELSTLQVSIEAADEDLPAQQLRFALVSGPEGATIDPITGVFTWAPTEEQGPALPTVQVKVTDNGNPALSDTTEFHVLVRELNVPPTLARVATQHVRRGSALVVNLLVTDPDLPAQTMRFDFLSAPAGAALDPATGVFTWTPGAGVAADSYLVRLKVTDSGSPALSATLEFQVQVELFNAAPTLVQIEDQVVDELVSMVLTNLAEDADLPPQVLVHQVLSGPDGLSIDPATGAVTWTPSESQGPGSYAVRLQVSDNGTPVMSATNEFQVTVRETNVAPLLTTLDDRVVHEFERLAVACFTVDTDLPVQDLTYELLVAPAGMTLHAASGFITWTPGETDGLDSHLVRVKVSDHGDPVLTSTNEFHVAVRELNTGPTLAAVPDQTLTEGQSLSLTVTASDRDIPANNLRFSLEPSTPFGVSIDPLTGLVRWTPADWQRPGGYTISVRVTDDGVPAVSAVRSFAVTLTGPTGGTVILRNAAASLVKYGGSTDVPASLRNQSLAVTANTGNGLADYRVALYWGVLGSTEDQLRQIGSPATIAPVAGRFTAGTRATGAATPPGSPATFQVRTWSHGSIYPTYEAASASGDPRVFLGSSALFQNATGGSGSPPSPALVLAAFPGIPDVHPLLPGALVLNTPPAFEPLDDIIIDELADLRITLRATDTDVPAQVLRYELLSGPAGAQVDPGTGVLTWTPSEENFWGAVGFRVQVTDNGEPTLSDIGEFYVIIEEVNSAPTVDLIADQAIAPGQTLSLWVKADDADVPADLLQFSLDPGAPAGLEINALTGRLTWTPGPGQPLGFYRVTVRVTDDGSPPLSSARTFNVSLLQLETVINSLEILPDGTVVLSWTPLVGIRVEVEYADNLNEPDWKKLEGAAEGIAQDRSPHPGMRYYRLKLADSP